MQQRQLCTIIKYSKVWVVIIAKHFLCINGENSNGSSYQLQWSEVAQGGTGGYLEHCARGNVEIRLKGDYWGVIITITIIIIASVIIVIIIIMNLEQRTVE